MLPRNHGKLRRHRALATALLVVPLLLPARAEIPRPRVSGPLTVGPDSYPFGGAAHTRVPTDLAASGYEVPFDAAKLAALYPSKEAWVRAVAANVAALVQARFITPEDGRDQIEEAGARPWPDRPGPRSPARP